MTVLIGFNAQQGGSNKFSVIDASSVGTITSVGIQRFIMNESCERPVDFIANAYFFGMQVNDLTSCIGWKLHLETRSTISVVLI